MLHIVLKAIRIFYDYFLNTDRNQINTASLIGSETPASVRFCWLSSHAPLKKIKTNKTEQSNRFSLQSWPTCKFVDKGVKCRLQWKTSSLQLTQISNCKRLTSTGLGTMHFQAVVRRYYLEKYKFSSRFCLIFGAIKAFLKRIGCYLQSEQE